MLILKDFVDRSSVRRSDSELFIIKFRFDNEELYLEDNCRSGPTMHMCAASFSLKLSDFRKLYLGSSRSLRVLDELPLELKVWRIVV